MSFPLTFARLRGTLSAVLGMQPVVDPLLGLRRASAEARGSSRRARLAAGDESARPSSASASSDERKNAASTTRARRVLISEDDDGFRSALATSLRMAGYLVTETHDGRELLEALQATPPGFFDIVIADHRMPRLSGLECLAQAGARAPFVLLSGVQDPTFLASAQRFGAAAVLQKPIDLEALLSLVRGVLAPR